MAYDQVLASRIREVIGPLPEITEKKIFGGVCYLLNGNMACGVIKDGLIVRLAPAQFETARSRPGTRPFAMSGKPMTGWLVVDPEGTASEADLRGWVGQTLDFARSLPPK